MLTQKPYLIHAIYEWCCDYNYTPYLVTLVDTNTIVPKEYVENGQIILNLAFNAVKELEINKEQLTFSASFNSIQYELVIPMYNIIGIFAKENGQGMKFQPDPKTQKSPGIKLVK